MIDGDNVRVDVGRETGLLVLKSATDKSEIFPDNIDGLATGCVDKKGSDGFPLGNL